MNNIHPDWQHEEEAVPVRIAESKDEVAQEVSRRPAAIVGMLLVIGIGIGFFRGVDSLKGQIVDEELSGITITITENGFVPSYLEVERGDTITWISDVEGSVTLQSDTLCSDNAYCLYSDELQPGEKFSFSITQSMLGGSYSYSSTETKMLGQLYVLSNDDEFVDVTAEFTQELLGSAPEEEQNPFAEEVELEEASASSAAYEPPVTSPPLANTGIARNPYTVDSVRQGDPTPVQTVFAQTGGPLRQPQTGAEIWIVLLGSIAGLLWVTRGMFATR